MVMTMEFVDYVHRNGIILAPPLPAHTTHRLQPLDVRIFSPLAKAYSDELDRFVIQTQLCRDENKKDDFWRISTLMVPGP